MLDLKLCRSSSDCTIEAKSWFIIWQAGNLDWACEERQIANPCKWLWTLQADFFFFPFFPPVPCPLKLFFLLSYLVPTKYLQSSSLRMGAFSMLFCPSFAESTVGKRDETWKRNQNQGARPGTVEWRCRISLYHTYANPLSGALAHYKRKSTILKMIHWIRACFEGKNAWGQTCKSKKKKKKNWEKRLLRQEK